MYKKVRIVDQYIRSAETLLDIGMGTGELIRLNKHKFKKIWGIDVDAESVESCRRRFRNDERITLMQRGVDELENSFESGQFDYIALPGYTGTDGDRRL